MTICSSQPELQPQGKRQKYKKKKKSETCSELVRSIYLLPYDSPLNKVSLLARDVEREFGTLRLELRYRHFGVIRHDGEGREKKREQKKVRERESNGWGME